MPMTVEYDLGDHGVALWIAFRGDGGIVYREAMRKAIGAQVKPVFSPPRVSVGHFPRDLDSYSKSSLLSAFID